MEKGRNNRGSTGSSRAQRALSAFVLMILLLAAFFLRARMASLPAFSSQQQPFMRDENGDPYLTEMDSYFYLRKAAEMTRTGIVQWRTDRAEDLMRGSRTGAEEGSTTLPLGLSVLAYWIWRFLSPLGVPLTRIAVWMGPVMGSLSVIPAFPYARKRSGLTGGIAAGVLAGCAVPFVLHTHAGFFDTDMLLSPLPLTAMLCLVESMRKSRFSSQLKYSLLSAAAFAGIALCWSAYAFYCLLALGCVALTLVVSLICPLTRKGRSTLARGGAMTMGLVLLLLLLLYGKDFPRQIADAVRTYGQTASGEDQMPYVFAFTEEMQPLHFFPEGSFLYWWTAGTNSVLGRVGGLVPMMLAVLYFPIMILAVRQTKENAAAFSGSSEARAAFLPEACILLPWTAAGLWLTCAMGLRFAEIAILPLSMLAGLTLGQLMLWTEDTAFNRKGLRKGLLWAVCAAAVVPSFIGSWKAPESNLSFVNDALQEAMSYIRGNTTEDTAIAAWWDDGYYLEYESQRRTLADGGTDSSKMQYFLAKALLSSDPALSRGILRMLNEGGTAALDALTKDGMSQAEAASLLLQLLPVSRAEAAQMLQQDNLPLSLLDLTHPASPGPLLLTLTTDLPAKYRALTYYGFWNPETRSQEEGGYIMPPTGSCRLENGYGEIPVLGTYGFTIVLRQDESGELHAVYRHQDVELESGRVELWEAGELIFSEKADSRRPSILLVREGEWYTGMICTDNLAESLLIRALFCEANDLSGFRRQGTWYGDTSVSPSAAFQRVNASDRAAFAAQVWDVDP